MGSFLGKEEMREDIYQFRRTSTTLITTPGVDFSGKITQVYSNGDFEVWKKSPGTCWNGVGMPHRYVPAETWLVQIKDHYFPLSQNTGKVFVILEKAEHGRKFQATCDRLIMRCDKLAEEGKL